MQPLEANMDAWNPSKLLSVKELAEALNISTVSLNKWRSKGGGPPYFNIGTSIRYRWGEVLKWLEERKRTRTSTDEPVSDNTSTTHDPGDDDPKRGR
jgi:predicted DNA-binding transcriptional regulator AlpA